jgi:hypothetical protein
MSGLYREEPLGGRKPAAPPPPTGRFRVRGRMYQVGIEGYWDDLEARYALICKICFGPGEKPK